MKQNKLEKGIGKVEELVNKVLFSKSNKTQSLEKPRKEELQSPKHLSARSLSRKDLKEAIKFTRKTLEDYEIIEKETPLIKFEKLKAFISEKKTKDFIQKYMNEHGKDILYGIGRFEDFKELRKDLLKLGINYSAKYNYNGNNFIISSVNKDHKKEKIKFPDIKEKSKTYFDKGKIYTSYTPHKDTTEKKEFIKSFAGQYVISKKGNLHIVNNSAFTLEGEHSEIHMCTKKGNEFYGYVKPVASAGWIEIENGKIKKIDNVSGNYDVSTEQLKVAARYLKNHDVLSKDFKMSVYLKNDEYTLSDIENFDIAKILGEYPEVQY